MSDEDLDVLAAAFDAQRARLVRVAYAILGTLGDAEDVVADCWERLVAQQRRDPVHDVTGWAVVAVSRRALDVARSARARREEYVGPWLPEPLVTTGEAGDPAETVTLDDEVSYALLVLLETLTPAERTAFVLHDLFGLPFPEVAAVVGRTPAAVRQLASRARRQVRAGAGRGAVDPVEHRRVVDAFAAAAGSGDLDALVAVLDPRAVLVSDGGGVVRAARRPVVGAEKVARFLLGTMAKAQGEVAMARINGAGGFVVRRGGQVDTVLALTVGGGRVVRLDLMRAPAKLAHLGL